MQRISLLSLFIDSASKQKKADFIEIGFLLFRSVHDFLFTTKYSNQAGRKIRARISCRPFLRMFWAGYRQIGSHQGCGCVDHSLWTAIARESLFHFGWEAAACASRGGRAHLHRWGQPSTRLFREWWTEADWFCHHLWWLWKAMSKYASVGLNNIFNLPFALKFLDRVDEAAFARAFVGRSLWLGAWLRVMR